MTQSNQPRRSELLAAVEKRNLDHRAQRAGWLRAAVLGGIIGMAITAGVGQHAHISGI